MLFDVLQFASAAAAIVAPGGTGFARFVVRLSDLAGVGRLLAGTVLPGVAEQLDEYALPPA